MATVEPSPDWPKAIRKSGDARLGGCSTSRTTGPSSRGVQREVDCRPWIMGVVRDSQADEMNEPRGTLM